MELFEKAELPLAVHWFKGNLINGDWSEQATNYTLVKVDGNGWIFSDPNSDRVTGYETIDLFVTAEDGTLHRFSEEENGYSISDALVDLVVKLADVQRSINWQPLHRYERKNVDINNPSEDCFPENGQ